MFKRIETEWIFDCQGITASRFLGPAWMYRIYLLADGGKIPTFFGWIFQRLCKITKSEIQSREMTQNEKKQFRIVQDIIDTYKLFFPMSSMTVGQSFQGLESIIGGENDT